MNRQQLNSDLLINLLVSMNMNNLLLLNNARFDRADKTAAKEAIDQMIDKTNKLTAASKIIDAEEQ